MPSICSGFSSTTVGPPLRLRRVAIVRSFRRAVSVEHFQVGPDVHQPPVQSLHLAVGLLLQAGRVVRVWLREEGDRAEVLDVRHATDAPSDPMGTRYDSGDTPCTSSVAW